MLRFSDGVGWPRCHRISTLQILSIDETHIARDLGEATIVDRAGCGPQTSMRYAVLLGSCAAGLATIERNTATRASVGGVHGRVVGQVAAGVAGGDDAAGGRGAVDGKGLKAGDRGAGTILENVSEHKSIFEGSNVRLW